MKKIKRISNLKTLNFKNPQFQKFEIEKYLNKLIVIRINNNSNLGHVEIKGKLYLNDTNHNEFFVRSEKLIKNKKGFSLNLSAPSGQVDFHFRAIKNLIAKSYLNELDIPIIDLEFGENNSLPAYVSSYIDISLDTYLSSKNKVEIILYDEVSGNLGKFSGILNYDKNRDLYYLQNHLNTNIIVNFKKNAVKGIDAMYYSILLQL